MEEVREQSGPSLLRAARWPAGRLSKKVPHSAIHMCEAMFSRNCVNHGRERKSYSSRVATDSPRSRDHSAAVTPPTPSFLTVFYFSVCRIIN